MKTKKFRKELRAFQKVIDTIKSCKSFAQLSTARRYMTLFINKYPRPGVDDVRTPFLHDLADSQWDKIISVERARLARINP